MNKPKKKTATVLAEDSKQKQDSRNPVFVLFIRYSHAT